MTSAGAPSHSTAPSRTAIKRSDSEVTSGMGAVDSLYDGYGEGAPAGRGPDQTRITLEGNAYLAREFPKLDYIVTAHVSQEWKTGK